MELIRNFKELNKNDAPIAGGKGASLGEMTQAGIPVPPGFVVLSSTFDQFIKDADLIQEIEALLGKVDHREIHTVENASEQIQGLIKNAIMPKNIAEEVKKQFKNLNTEYVAVRSSATAEDGAEHAWAGQLDSFLNTTEKDLLEKVQHCWASLFTPRAIFYRFEKGLYATQISVAVVVQKMVNSEISGIAFSVHPVTEDHNQLIIEAGLGLGEAIVSGQITPDSYVVEKEPRRIIDTNVNTQARALYRVGGGGNEWQEIAEPKASSQVLNEAQVLELSNIILGIEKHYGFPCDIEWAFEASKFYVVQSRPITTLSGVVKKEIKEPEFKIIAKDFNSYYFRNYVWIKGINKARSILPLFDKESESALAIEGKNGDIVYLYNEKKWAKMHEQFTDKLENNFNVLIKVVKDTNAYAEKVNRKAKKIFEKGFKDKSNRELIKNLHMMAEWQEKIYAYGVLLPLLDLAHNAFVEDNVRAILRKKLCKEDVHEEFQIISYPGNETFAFKQERDLLSLAQKFYDNTSLRKVILKNELKDALYIIAQSFKKEFKLLQKHTKANRWVYYSFIGPAYDEVKFLEFIKNELTDEKLPKDKLKNILNDKKEIIAKKNKLIRSLKVSLAEKKVLNFAGIFVWAKPTRKDYQSQLDFYMIEGVIDEIALRSGVERKLLLSCPFEDLEKIADKKSIDVEKMTAIFSHHILLPGEYEPKLYYGESIGEVSDRIEKEKIVVNSSDSIKGSTAMGGFGKGVVRIINKPEDMGKMNKGDVLVSVATTPSIVPVMKMAAAIITDEGGLTCHAAIVSREMGTPCVIGTKIATQVLKDGDMVEVDADNGVVRMLEKIGGQSMSITTLREFEVNEYKPNFQKLLSRKHCLLADEIIATAWNDQERFVSLTGFPDCVKYLEIVDGDFYFDFEWVDGIIGKYKDSDLKIFQDFINNGYTHGEIIKNYSRNCISAHSKDGLIAQFEESTDLLKNLLVFLPITHPLVKIIEGKVAQILKEKGVKDEELDEALFDASTPIKKNTTVLENEDLLKIKKAYQNSKDFNLDHAFEKHSDDYGFLGYREPFSGGYDKKFFEARLTDQNTEAKQHKIASIKFTKDEQKYVDLLKEFVYFRTYRTEKLYESLYYLEPLWKKIAQEFGLKNEIDIGWYGLADVRDLFRSGDRVADFELDKRKIGHAILLHNNQTEIVFADKMFDYKKKYYPEQKAGANKMLGVAACKGKVSGIAKVVISSKDQDKIKSGDILVTAMTTPDFLPSMNRAAAFVTDEGGITCHAAIVAREMNKPCIIGTKIATQVLKDGDIVEVDADNGVVRILEKARGQSQSIAALVQEDNDYEKHRSNIIFNSDKDRIADYLKSHRMDIQNARGSFFAVDLVFSSYVESENIHGLKFTPILTYLEGGNNFFQIISDENIMNVARRVYEDYLVDEKTLDIKINAHTKITKEIDALWENHKKKENITDQELLEFFRKMIQMSRNWWLYGVIGEDKGRLIDEEIIPLFEKNHTIDKNKAFEIISILSHSEEQAAFSMERKSFYEICSYVSSIDGLKMAVLNDDVFAIKNDRQFMVNFEEYRKNYFYKNTDFSDRKEVTVETFIAELKLEIQKNTSEKIKGEIAGIENAIQEIKRNKQKILLATVFTPEEKKLINFAYKITHWIDTRKVGMMKQFYYIFSLLHEVAERYHVKYEDIAVLFVPEVERLLGAKKGLCAEDLEKRRKSLMIVYETGEQVKIFYGQDANNMFQLSKGILDNFNGLKGSVASKGNNKIVSGVVRIIEDPANDVFYEDEILVTSMTRIEFVPLMKKAKMIITDEGGIACHAAIVSRELGVPCIIGTKNATDILANGDVIEADIEKGVITVIKKYGN